MKSSGENGAFVDICEADEFFEIFLVGSILVARAKVHTHHLKSSCAKQLTQMRSNKDQNKETSLGFAFFCKEDREGGTLVVNS